MFTETEFEAIDRLERDVEALRGFLLAVSEAALQAAQALETEED